MRSVHGAILEPPNIYFSIQERVEIRRLLERAQPVSHVNEEKQIFEQSIQDVSASEDALKKAQDDYKKAEENRFSIRPMGKADIIFGASFSASFASLISGVILLTVLTGPFMPIFFGIMIALGFIGMVISGIYKGRKERSSEIALIENSNRSLETRNQCIANYMRAKEELQKAAQILSKKLDESLPEQELITINLIPMQQRKEDKDTPSITELNHITLFATPPSSPTTVKEVETPPVQNPPLLGRGPTSRPIK